MYSLTSWNILNPLISTKGTNYSFLQYLKGNWFSLSCSNNGETVLAVNTYLPLNMIFLSNNYGSTWQNITGSIGSVNLGYVCNSENVSDIYLTSPYHDLYVSNNSGSTWVSYKSQVTDPNVNFNSLYVGCSNDGTIVLTIILSYSQVYLVFLSSDSGSTFNQILTSYTSEIWSGVAVSGNGNTMVIIATNGTCLLSTDSGNTWNNITFDNNPNWCSVSIDSTGLNIVLASSNGYIYFSSNNGSTWASCAPQSLPWSCVYITSEANVIFAAAINNTIYYSYNNGSSWTPTYPNNKSTNNWSSITASSDGSVVYACINGGDIYSATST
jgi:hypothetical protein